MRPQIPRMKNISPPVSTLSPMVLLGEGNTCPQPHSAADGGPGAKGFRYLNASLVEGRRFQAWFTLCCWLKGWELVGLDCLLPLVGG